MNDLYEALEICLEQLEQGADINSVLFRYPEFAEELRPILEASVSARNLEVPLPSAEAELRNRARILQRAAEMRKTRVKPSTRRIWFVSLRRVAVAFAVIAILFASGTNLVRAASTTLPGDQLYPVKRTWEDVLVLITFDVQQRRALEVEQENERLSELQDLFAEGRSAKVDFAGSVSSQNGNQWVIAGIPVEVSTQTVMTGQPILVGSAVHVIGQTQDHHVVLAEQIELLPSGAIVPDEKETEQSGLEAENTPGSGKQIEEGSGKQSPAEDNAPKNRETQAPEATSEPTDRIEKQSTQEPSQQNQQDYGGEHSGSGGSGETSSGGDH